MFESRTFAIYKSSVYLQIRVIGSLWSNTCKIYTWYLCVW